ncbi:MAG: RNA polymerase sigma factor for flagellar operon FliA [Planctomycetota bacterium]|jgi:RNA polymerase sigma factor for flagellar operon FliA
MSSPQPVVRSPRLARLKSMHLIPTAKPQPVIPEENQKQGDGDGGQGGSSAAELQKQERIRQTDLLWRVFWRRPSDEARNALVEAYQWLVVACVRRFAVRLPRSVDRGDLLTAGSVGLMGAISSFDPTRRVRFEVYADTRIRGALLDELRKEDWLPRPRRRRLEQQKRMVGSLRASLGRDPYDDEIAEGLGLSLEVYEQTFGNGLPGAPNGSAHLNELSGEAALDIVPDTRHDGPDEQLTRDELLRLVAQRLSQTEYRIVYLKYWEELPMREIGELTNLSESRVSKIHAKLIERLQDRFRVHLEESF